MAEGSRKDTLLAVVQSGGEGSPQAPVSSSESIPLREGSEFAPSFATLENDELTGSLGASAPVQGLESPTASIPAYLRNSGGAAAPDHAPFIKAFFGSEDTKTERNTIAGSSKGDADAAAIIKVDAGEGAADFERGQALLIKNPLGTEVRNIDSIATDDLTLAFNLEFDPVASGIDLGSAIFYKPADSGHDRLSLWRYKGDGAALEMVQDSVVNAMNLTFPASEFITADYEFQGTKYSFNPIIIESADTFLDFEDDSGVVAAQISAKIYRDPHELADALQTAMNAVATDAVTVDYSDSDSKFTIASDGATTFSLLFQSGGNTANTIADKIGFDTIDETGSFSYTSDDEQSWSNPFGVDFDLEDPLVAKANEILMGDFSSDGGVPTCLENSNVSVSCTNEVTEVLDSCAESGKSGNVINGRTFSIEVETYLKRNDVDKFRRFRSNQTTKFSYTAGRKSGGNWVEGSVVNVYSPSMKINEYVLADDDFIIKLNMTLTAFVESGNEEFFLNFL